MKTLFLAWGCTHSDTSIGTDSLSWFPIGRLEWELGWFRFGYMRGVLAAQAKTGFQPLAAFPRFDQVYESGELFPLFRNRVISPTREDYSEYLDRLSLCADQADPFEILAISGGVRQTDNLEVFPKILTRCDGSFSCRFFLRGWRHMNLLSQDRLNCLQPDEELQVHFDMNNPGTESAVQLQAMNDHSILGWAPRYLNHDVLRAASGGPSRFRARVVRLNQPPSPQSQRVLIELEGTFPAGYEPMNNEEFHRLHC